MSRPRWLTHFGFDAPPFHKDIADEQLWVPSSRQRVLDRLVEAYGGANEGELIACFEKIEKRLGSRNLKEARELVQAGDLGGAATIGLRYYDRAYEYGMQKQPEGQVTRIEVDRQPPEELAEIVIDAANQLDSNQGAGAI